MLAAVDNLKHRALLLTTYATEGSALELADIFRAEGARYRASHRLSMHQQRAMHAIEVCRTPELGGHVAACDHCGATTLHYHSCRNRACPKCQTLTKLRWVEARQAQLLDIEQYVHVVFTLPHALNALAQGNPRLLYNLLFQCAAATLQGFSPAIPNGLTARASSASPWSCIRGARISATTCTCIAWSAAGRFLSMANAGFAPRPGSCSLSVRCPRYSEPNTSMHSSVPQRTANSTSTAQPPSSLHLNAS